VDIRPATAADWAAIWPFFAEIVRAQETYAYDPAIGPDEARASWYAEAPWHIVVAVEDGEVLATAKAGPNRPGPGSHVATASFMVSGRARGRGVGRALGEYVLAWCTAEGYRAVQFNAVVETNVAAVRLWRDLGFGVVGTVPEAFASPTHGLVGLHVMHRRLP
jgi:L-amino acid N-acyltransferase YncA